MRKCTSCGYSIAGENPRFCGNCGQELSIPLLDPSPTPPEGSLNLCRACGAQLSENSKFCGACGAAVIDKGPGTPDTPPAVIPESPKSPSRSEKGAPGAPKPSFFKKRREQSPKPHGRLSFRRLFRKTVRLIMILGVLYAGVLFLLSQEHKLGLWEKFTFQRTLDAWKKDNDATAQEKPLLEAVKALADKLDSGDLEGALQYVSPSRQEAFRKDYEALRQDPAALAALAAALRQATVTFIGTADENPEEAPFRAQVSVPVEKLSHTMTWIRMNERWVVTRL